MIEKLNIDPTQSVATNHCIINKINELVDAVNAIQKEREAEWFEIKEWIGILEAVRESVNVHEKQIDELQMKVELEKCKPEENTQDENPRCPFCGEELSYAQETDGGFEILTCDCPHGIWLFGNDKMWHNLDRTRKALVKGMEHITGLNNMIESWLNLIDSDLDQETKLRILKSAISAYVENKGGDNE